MATSANHLIEVHDLVKKFGANIVALDKVNLTIDKGEVVVIVGPRARENPLCCAR